MARKLKGLQKQINALYYASKLDKDTIISRLNITEKEFNTLIVSEARWLRNGK